MKLFSHTSPAIRNLYFYNIFVSLTLTIAANYTFLDRLFLRLQIDLGNFGFIKSIMFLLPAVSYQLCTPLLQKLNKDIEICAFSYALRAALPLLLPFLAIFCTDKTVLTWACALLPAGGMLFAVFANNSLMKIYRQVIPLDKYNYTTGMMNTFLSFPVFLLALPMAWLLDRFNGLADREFYLLFALLQLFTFIFEIPALVFLFRVKLRSAGTAAASASAKSSLLQPYRSPDLRLMLLLNFLLRAGSGLSLAYLTVFFLKVVNWSMTLLIVVELILTAASDLFRPFSGRMLDRWGCAGLFPFFAGGLLLGVAGLCIFWGSVWILPFFILLTWNGLNSFCAVTLSQGIYAATGKLADKSWIGSAVAASSLTGNGGFFAGFLCSSWLYSLAAGLGGSVLGTTLRWYYILTLPCFFAIFALAFVIRRRKIM